MNNKKNEMLELPTLSENYMRFSHIALMSFMRQVVQNHNEHYQSDFEIDKKMLWETTEQQERDGFQEREPGIYRENL